MSGQTNWIDRMLCYLNAGEPWIVSVRDCAQYHNAVMALRAELAALIAERDELQSKVNAHAEDRRQYIEAWAHWIEFKSALGIEEWLRVYADAVPAPPPDGDEAKRRIYDHLDQRMRDAADMITALIAERDKLKQRVEELESQEFTLPHDPFRDPDRDLRERLVCAIWPEILRIFERSDTTHNNGANWELVRINARDRALTEADAMLAAMRKGEA